MIKTNIVLKKNSTILKIKTKEEINCIKTYCILSYNLNKTTINSNFECNKNISMVEYMKILTKEVNFLTSNCKSLIEEI